MIPIPTQQNPPHFSSSFFLELEKTSGMPEVPAEKSVIENHVFTKFTLLEGGFFFFVGSSKVILPTFAADREMCLYSKRGERERFLVYS